ncbi:hypothetical protein AB2762_07605 [Acinetobacter indicus]
MSQSFDYINFNDFYLDRFGGDYDESIVDDVVSFVQSVRPSKKKKPLNFSLAAKETCINVRKGKLGAIAKYVIALYTLNRLK